MHDLPEDVIHDIMLRLTDHRDVISCGRTQWKLHMFTEKLCVWHQLCHFHFCNTEEYVIAMGTERKCPNDTVMYNTDYWKQLYRNLHRLDTILKFKCLSDP